MMMAVKQTGQPSFIDAWLPKGAGANAALDRLSRLVKWYRFEKLIGHLRDEGSPGRPGYPVLVLFRALLLQSLYGLSERELEEALGDRLSFKRFVGLSLEDATPDHTVLFGTSWLKKVCWRSCLANWIVSLRMPGSSSSAARCWTQP
jgi:IS5 family transposase